MYVCMYDYIAVSTRTLTPPTTCVVLNASSQLQEACASAPLVHLLHNALMATAKWTCCSCSMQLFIAGHACARSGRPDVNQCFNTKLEQEVEVACVTLMHVDTRNGQ